MKFRSVWIWHQYIFHWNICFLSHIYFWGKFYFAMEFRHLEEVLYIIREYCKYKNSHYDWYTVKKKKFFIKDFFSKCDQIRSFLRIWSHLLKKSLMENFFLCAVIFEQIKSDIDHSFPSETTMVITYFARRRQPLASFEISHFILWH